MNVNKQVKLKKDLRAVGKSGVDEIENWEIDEEYYNSYPAGENF